MITDVEIRSAMATGDLGIDPFAEECLQPASYDFRVGNQAFLSGTDSVADVANRGLIIIEPGELTVIATRESIRCGPQ